MIVKKPMRVILILFIGAFIPTICFGEEQDVVLIAHRTVAKSLSKESVKQIFLGKKTRWDNDEKIIFAVVSDKTTCSQFLKEYVGKTYSQYRNYWKKQVFTGKGRMPISFRTPEELVNFICHTEGAISFVRLQDIGDAKVTVISVAD